MKILAKIWCLLFGHNYSVTKVITRDIKEIECLCCHKEWAMNDSMECILPLDDDLKELHKYLTDK